MTRSIALRILLPLFLLLSLDSCNKERRAHVPFAPTDTASFHKRWYFERMRGYGAASAYLQFVSDSVLIDNGSNVHYSIDGDSLVAMYADGPFARTMSVTKDTLILRSDVCIEYYSHHAPEWFSPRFSQKVLGPWWPKSNDPAIAWHVEDGFITYPHPTYSDRAELRDRVLTRYNRDGIERDTIDAITPDTLTYHSGHGVIKLHRHKE